MGLIKSVSYQIGVDCVGQPLLVKHVIGQHISTNNSNSPLNGQSNNKQTYKIWNRKV